MFEIKHINGNTLFKSKTALNVKNCLIDAVKSQAYLQGADLRGAYLRGAYLQKADLRGACLHEEKQSIAPYLISNLFESYEIVITRNSMAIGCKIHTHAEWKSFDDDELTEIAQSDMDNEDSGEVVDAFKLLRPTLVRLCLAHKKASDAVATIAQLESDMAVRI